MPDVTPQRSHLTRDDSTRVIFFPRIAAAAQSLTQSRPLLELAGGGDMSIWGRKKITAVAGAMALAMASLAGASTAGAQSTAAPGEPELFNLEHVYNFNPRQHDPRAKDPAAEPYAGSDVEFFAHRVPLRNYKTGALVNRKGKPLPRGAKPVMAKRDFAVMGSYQRGGYVFDVTNPQRPRFVSQVTCRQDRNDVAIKKLRDGAGRMHVVLALSQQSGNPCPNYGGVGVNVTAPDKLRDFHNGVQWGDTGEVARQSGKLVYAGTGCTAASYAPVADQIQGNIALVDARQSATNPADSCPTYTFVQKVRAAQAAGADALVQIPAKGDQPRGNATAINADIPAIELFRTKTAVATRNAVVDGTTVKATIGNAPAKSPLLGEGSGGVGVFDITDPYKWSPMYRLRTGHGGVHNFIFHPTKPYGYASNGALPGGLNEIPIVDFTKPFHPKVLRGPDTEGGVHDLEFSPDGTRAYAASENNYRIYDTSKPWRPELLSRTPNVGSYAHGVFPSSDKKLMVTNNESLVIGGFLVEGTGVCPGEGLASYDTTDESSPQGPLGYYVPDVNGPTDERPCTSHFGRFFPGTKILSMGWYIAGTRIVDWSDPANPVEVASAVMKNTNTWAAKFHKGPYVYAGDIGRGFDVFRWSGKGKAPWLR
ncbi:MAG: hypothetical protein GEV04_07275 [Actinophytocola sp.]|nr:hypothetical protein [Actinophytocola sp.]